MLKLATALLVGMMCGMFSASQVKAQVEGLTLSLPQPMKPGDILWKHTENHDWYNQHLPNCCDGTDCRETVAKWSPEGWSTLVDGQWYTVPDAAVRKDAQGIPITHPSGKPQVCAGFYTKKIWCFAVPNTEM